MRARRQAQYCKVTSAVRPRCSSAGGRRGQRQTDRQRVRESQRKSERVSQSQRVPDRAESRLAPCCAAFCAAAGDRDRHTESKPSTHSCVRPIPESERLVPACVDERLSEAFYRLQSYDCTVYPYENPKMARRHHRRVKPVAQSFIRATPVGQWDGGSRGVALSSGESVCLSLSLPPSLSVSDGTLPLAAAGQDVAQRSELRATLHTQNHTHRPHTNHSSPSDLSLALSLSPSLSLSRHGRCRAPLSA